MKLQRYLWALIGSRHARRLPRAAQSYPYSFAHFALQSRRVSKTLLDGFEPRAIGRDYAC